MQKLASVLAGPPEVAQEGLQEARQGAAHRLSGLGEAFRARLGAFLALPEEVLAEVEACHLAWSNFGVKYRLGVEMLTARMLTASQEHAWSDLRQLASELAAPVCGCRATSLARPQEKAGASVTIQLGYC